MRIPVYGRCVQKEKGQDGRGGKRREVEEAKEEEEEEEDEDGLARAVHRCTAVRGGQEERKGGWKDRAMGCRRGGG